MRCFLFTEESKYLKLQILPDSFVFVQLYKASFLYLNTYLTNRLAYTHFEMFSFSLKLLEIHAQALLLVLDQIPPIPNTDTSGKYDVVTFSGVLGSVLKKLL